MSGSPNPPRERPRFRYAVAAIALFAVGAVAAAQYYAAGIHEIYFSNGSHARAALLRYLTGNYGSAGRNLRLHLQTHPSFDRQRDPAQVLVERGENNEALALLAIIETRAGDYERAIASWQRALRYDAPGTRLTVYAAALEATDDVLRAAPRAGRDALLAQLFRYLRYYDRSLASAVRAHAQRAIDAGDHPADGWIALGDVLGREGNADAAHAAFVRATELDPRHADAQFRLARAASDRGDLAGELAAARRAYAAAPDAVLAEWLLRLLATKFGDYGSVVSIAKARLAEGRREHAVLTELGRAQGALGDFPAAIESFSLALELEPGNAGTMAHLAYWHARAGQREQAIAVASRAAAERPDWSYPLLVVARAMAEDFRYADAIPVYEAAFRVEAPKTDDLAHLCTLYHGASRWRAGLECFESVLRRDPRNARAQRMLAESRSNAALAAKLQGVEKR
jgi:protein O-GlcNAc transferase